MAIDWVKTKDVYPDAGYGETHFMAFDDELRLQDSMIIGGDAIVGTVRQIDSGPQKDLFQWSVTASLPGPFYATPANGVQATSGEAARKMIERYRHYLSTRPGPYLKG